MINLSDIKFHILAVHQIGNKMQDEGYKLSNDVIVPKGDALKNTLIKYFTSSFKFNELYSLFHDSDLQLNEVYSYVSKIFIDAGEIYNQSINLAKHLYEKSTHPKIKSGEFYVVFFRDCIINDEVLDAVGLFKSESKETYLKVLQSGENFMLEYDDGININRLDKGALIFNYEKDKGYLVAIVDNLSKTAEAQYWKDDFLHVQPREDDYHHTNNVLSLCKDFVVGKLADEFEVNKADQADLLNKSLKFFKEKKNFSLDDFSEEVMQQPEVIDAFKEYKNQYQTDRQLKIVDNFDISGQAVKKQSRIFKSVIKLDKNFHIYIHGNREMIERGKDENTGLSYYKLYFEEEA